MVWLIISDPQRWLTAELSPEVCQHGYERHCSIFLHFCQRAQRNPKDYQHTAPAITHTKHLQTATRIIRVRLRLWELIVTQKTIQEKWYEDMEGWYFSTFSKHLVDGFNHIWDDAASRFTRFGLIRHNKPSFLELQRYANTCISYVMCLNTWKACCHLALTHWTHSYRFVSARWAHVHYTGPEAYEVRSDRPEKAHIFQQSPQLNQQNSPFLEESIISILPVPCLAGSMLIGGWYKSTSPHQGWNWYNLSNYGTIECHRYIT